MHFSHPLPSGLYRRLRNCTGSTALAARGLRLSPSPPVGNFTPPLRLLASGLMYKKIGGKKGMAAGLAVGSVLMTLVMIPLNLMFTGIFMGTGVEAVVKMLIPAIIPFNLIKACLNSVLTFLLFIPVNKIYGKISVE